jgi:hypothetical protein
MSQGRGVRDALKSIVPSWLSDRAAGFNKGFKVLWTIAQIADGVIQTGIEGVQAALPGIGTPTALALIGASRGLIRGLTETDAEYAARLTTWLDVWVGAGSDETLISLLQNFLGPDSAGGPLPVVRMVNRAGLFTTIAANGTITQTLDTDWTIPASSWDTIYNPEREQWWSDLWIIVYSQINTLQRWPIYTSLTDPAWVAAWGGSELGFGHAVPRVAYQGVMNIIANFKAAAAYVQAVIFTTDTTLFVPGLLGITGDPDGRWGNFSCRDTGGIQIPIRTISTGGGIGAVRYWCPPKGG